MNRKQILWLQGCCALATGAIWISPPALGGSTQATIATALWAVVAFASIPLDFLENWSHRFSSFFGFLFFMLMTAMGLLGLSAKGLLFLWGLIPGFAFILALVGRYQGASRRRKPRTWDPQDYVLSTESQAEQKE